jgi:hypothetical protein
MMTGLLPGDEVLMSDKSVGIVIATIHGLETKEAATWCGPPLYYFLHGGQITGPHDARGTTLLMPAP